jgi:hypothetical protein
MNSMSRLACATLLLTLVPALHAAEQVRQALAKLAEEAAAFQRTAPHLAARETLRQRAIKPPKRHFGLGSPDQAREPEWQSREIVSEYGYAALSTGGLHEVRKAVTVDGMPVAENSDAVNRLATGIRSGDDASKKRLLEDFERLGLIGTVTDFGQIVLLFENGGIEQYEWQAIGTRLIGPDRALVLQYKQNGGPQRLTVWDRGRAVRAQIGGEVWVRESDLKPLRITLVSVRGEGTAAVREEAQVDYDVSRYGCVLPAAVTHREYRGTQMTAENRFTYSKFRKLGQ